MKPLLLDRESFEAPPLVEPGATLSDLLADLARRLTPEQGVAFRAKMAAMDIRRGQLSPAPVALGRA